MTRVHVDTGEACCHGGAVLAAPLLGKFVRLPLVGRLIPIIGDDYADPEKGTGAVKITPAHDFNDFDVGKRHELKQINILDQFGNPDNPLAHYDGTGPEIWRDTEGRVTHFVSSMGTTGTIMGVSRFLKEKNPAVQIIGGQPTEGAQIPGIRKWPAAYLPKICNWDQINRVIEVSQADAEDTTRRLAREEGIFAGVSSGGSVWAALKLSAEVENAVIVCIVLPSPISSANSACCLVER